LSIKEKKDKKLNNQKKESMADETENQENLSEDTGEAQGSGNKFSDFVSGNSKLLMIVGGVITLGLIISVLVYYALYYQSNLDEYAEQFCNCAEESDSEFYNYSNDGFGYRSDMSSCFAEDFKAYSERFNKIEKQELLVEFQEKVIARCPHKLANIFEYK
jgi:hypothetical protein